MSPVVSGSIDSLTSFISTVEAGHIQPYGPEAREYARPDGARVDVSVRSSQMFVVIKVTAPRPHTTIVSAIVPVGLWRTTVKEDRLSADDVRRSALRAVQDEREWVQVSRAGTHYGSAEALAGMSFLVLLPRSAHTSLL
jgi:hypothetical protein